MFCTGRSFVITIEARKPKEYSAVKNYDKFNFEFVNESEEFLLFL